MAFCLLSQLKALKTKLEEDKEKAEEKEEVKVSVL